MFSAGDTYLQFHRLHATRCRRLRSSDVGSDPRLVHGDRIDRTDTSGRRVQYLELVPTARLRRIQFLEGERYNLMNSIVKVSMAASCKSTAICRYYRLFRRTL